MINVDLAPLASPDALFAVLIMLCQPPHIGVTPQSLPNYYAIYDPEVFIQEVIDHGYEVYISDECKKN